MRRIRVVTKLFCSSVATVVLVVGITPPVAGDVTELAGQLSPAGDPMPAGLPDIPVPLRTTVTDRDGTPIAWLYVQDRIPLTPQQISPAMSAAIVSTEDRGFWQEGSGVDVTRMSHAALHDVTGGDSVQGASTITQQYVKNFLINVADRTNPEAQRADRAETLDRKLREARTAIRVTRTMPKRDILAGYLNVAGYTGNIYGVGAAAQAYFNTTADKLTVAQAALLAGMVNNPNLYDPYEHPQHTRARRNQVIDSMMETHTLSVQDAAAAKAAPLGVVPGGPTSPSSTCMGARPDAGFFCQYAQTYLEQSGFTGEQLATGGYTIKTTLDSHLSQVTKAAVEANVPTTQHGVANAFAVVQPGQTGHRVLAMVANRNYGVDAARGETMNNLVSDASNRFGAGSSYKLFTTAAALEQGTAGLTTPLPNPPRGCFRPPGGDSCYPVRNDGKYADPISLADGLATSPNSAFVGLESRVGVPAVVQMAYRLGLRNTLQTSTAGSAPITDPNDPLSHNPQYNQSQLSYMQDKLSFTLGNSPVSPLEMANVTATLKSSGVWCPPNPIESVTDRDGRPVPVPQQHCEQAVSPAVANTLLAGLSKDTISGTSAAAAKAAGWKRSDVGKTGTTEQSESVAFVGGVNDFAVASMVFADGNRPQELCPGPPVHLGSCGSGAFGGTVAAPPYFQAMTELLDHQPSQPVPAPNPAYLRATRHGPLVPYVVGQPADVAQGTVRDADYDVSTQDCPSTQLRGQVVGQTPQGNAPARTHVTLYISTGTVPSPSP